MKAKYLSVVTLAALVALTACQPPEGEKKAETPANRPKAKNPSLRLVQHLARLPKLLLLRPLAKPHAMPMAAFPLL